MAIHHRAIGRGGKPGKMRMTSHAAGQAAGRGRTRPGATQSGNRYLSGFSLELSGDSKRGGFLEFIVDGQVKGRIRLGAAPFLLLCELFAAALRAEHWTAALVSTAQLEKCLGEHGALTPPTPQKIYNLIFDIRGWIAATDVWQLTPDAALGGKIWAEQLVESETRHGYRPFGRRI
jgi:hypothetical protein